MRFHDGAMRLSRVSRVRPTRVHVTCVADFDGVVHLRRICCTSAGAPHDCASRCGADLYGPSARTVRSAPISDSVVGSRNSSRARNDACTATG